MDENLLENTLKELQDLLLQDNTVEACNKLADLHPSEISQILSSIDTKDRAILWDGIDDDTKGDILSEVNDNVKPSLIEVMDTKQIVASISSMDTDDLADIVPFLPESALHNLLLTLDNKHRINLKQILSYPANTAGGLMNTDIITIRPDVNVETVIRYLRLLGDMPKDTDQLFIVDRKFEYLGSVHISALLSSQPETLIKNLAINSTSPINGNTEDSEVAKLFEQRDLISAPVTDDDNQLIGRITIDDVVDVIRDLAEKSVKSMAGLGNDELFSPILQSAKNRAIWLGINLFTAFLAVFFIDIFAATMQETIALAVLMPVVASMGGIAGTQSLILITRGMATGVVNINNIFTLLNKEVLISIINGVIWAFVIAIITHLWFGNQTLSVIIAIAIIVNMFSAAIFGAILPILLDKLKIDPALSGGVILTTITDIVGFVTFLGLASIVL